MGLLSPFPPALLLLLLFANARSEKITLINTSTTSSELKWPVYPVLTESNGDGWAEETVPNDGSNLRTFVACALESENPRSWLIMPRIDRSTTRETGRITLNLKYSLRSCTEESGGKCKDNFDVYTRRYKGESDWKEMVDPNQFIETEWSFARRVHSVNPSDGNDMTLSEVPITFDWSAGDKGVYFAFLDTGACVSLMNIEVSFLSCEKMTSHLVLFNETAPLTDPTQYRNVWGECVENAEPIMKAPNANCKGDGSWNVVDGCVCKGGFYETKGVCMKCTHNRYSSRNSSSCDSCPRHSTVDQWRTGCNCEHGFHRIKGEDERSACYGAPSGVINLRANLERQTRVNLTWTRPIDDGGMARLYYRVECFDCTFKSMKVEKEHAIIDGLEPNTTYTIKVTPENEVSHKEVVESKETTVKTGAVVGSNKVDGVRIETTIEDQEVIVAWNALATPKIVTYQIEWSEIGTDRKSILTATSNSVAIPSLKKNGKYSFRVRADCDGLGAWSNGLKYQLGVGEITSTTHITTTKEPENGGSSREGGGNDIPHWVFALLIGMVAILVLLLVIGFRRRSNQNRKQMSDLDVLDTYKQDTMTPDYNSAHRPPFDPLSESFKKNKLNAPLIPYGDVHTPKSGSSHGGGAFSYGLAPSHNRFKPYVDPMAYEDPNQALTEFAFDIPAEAIRVTSVIGGGEFGDVCKAQMNVAMLRRMNVVLGTNNFEREIETVACKTLKEGSSSKAKADFLLEASIMGQFTHPNVVRLIGVVTKNEPVMIVTEFMAHGSLDQFLRSRDSRGDDIGISVMISMMAGVAGGMKYLTEKGFVHRDLAARNVLVDETLTCKISDFGLSRGVEKCVDQEYTTNGGKIPVRWTAPEAITHRKFTAASDVWSFGVVMWEVCSFGERPYWEWTNQKVISEIMAGYRLPAPMETPIALHRIMLRCWQLERHDRPTFAQLQSTLERYAAQPELVYLTENSGSGSSSGDGRVTSMANLSNPYGSVSVVCSPYGDSIPAPPSSAPPSSPPLDEFLRSLRLGHCYDRLVKAGVTRCDTLAKMNHLEMLACGLISEEYQRIREALSHLGAYHHHAPPSDRPLPPMRRGYADTVATMQSRQSGGRQREENGFFV